MTGPESDNKRCRGAGLASRFPERGGGEEKEEGGTRTNPGGQRVLDGESSGISYAEVDSFARELLNERSDVTSLAVQERMIKR